MSKDRVVDEVQAEEGSLRAPLMRGSGIGCRWLIAWVLLVMPWVLVSADGAAAANHRSAHHRPAHHHPTHHRPAHHARPHKPRLIGHPSISTTGRHAARAGKPARGVGKGASPVHNPYTGGGCTYWAWANRSDLPGNLGNALTWGTNAARDGFPVDGSPQVGDIAVYQPHVYGAFAPFGHVAVVEEVRGNQVYISEASYNPRLADDGDNEIYHRWTGIVGVQFIHHKGATTTPTPTPTPTPAPPAGTYPHHVYGTCAEGACGLRVHTAPTLSSQVVGTKQDGQEVDIACQVDGDVVTGRHGSSAVWDKLPDGTFVADYYVDTPGANGAFSPPIPQCGGTPPPPPAPPTCSDVTASTTTGQAAIVHLNCTAPSGQTATFATVAAPSHGTLDQLDAGAGTVRYTPAAGYTGDDSFTYEASDTGGSATPATVHMAVTSATASPAPPSCSGVTISTLAGQSVTVHLSCTAPSGQAMTFATGNPSHGALDQLDSTAGTVRYTPSSGYTGADSFTYQASDAGGAAAPATVQVTVQAPPPPAYYVHHVYGTCADGSCGLRERTGPGYSNYAIVGTLSDGNEVDIVCQTLGEQVTPNHGTASNVWDKLTNGSYVTDVYIDTSGTGGGFSPPIPQC